MSQGESGSWKTFFSDWELDHGLTLELNAYSPSDSEHNFKGFHFATDYEGESEGPGGDGPAWHEPKHGWVRGQKIKSSRPREIMRLFGRFFSLGRGLPPVTAVTHFVVRRQLRRRLTSSSLVYILGRLGRLQHMVYEPWREWKQWRIGIGDNGTSS